MQNVGAAWLMVALGAGPIYVALTQTAASLPSTRFLRKGTRIPGEDSLPLAYASHVHVHEVRTAIVAYSTAMQAQRRIPERGR